MRCSLCGKEADELARCSYCKKKVCRECLVETEIGLKVCSKCNEETARQINWDGFELGI